MAYKWQGENWGLSLIRDAIKAGYTIVVKCDGEIDYSGVSPNAAWHAVTAVEECHVVLHKDGCKSEWAFIVLEYNQPGDEVINDHSTGGWIEKWWDAKYALAGGVQ